MLAARSVHQGAIWTSDVALWTQAQRVAPGKPDPWIHGAMAVLDAPGDPRDNVRLDAAERLLARATRTIPQQSRDEQRWAHDAIAATTAVIRMRQGRLLEASVLMSGALPQTARGQLCLHFRAVCALADSSGS